MSNLHSWQSGTAAFLAFGITAGTIAPMMVAAPSFAQSTNFTDVSSSYWANQFIGELAQRDIIAGFPDGTFRPDAPVTRAQFAAMLRKANQSFKKATQRGGINFVDVPSRYWAYSAIQDSYTTGFLAGYPGNVFRPEQNIPREQVLVSLANGLDYSANSLNVLNFYNDATSISNWARSPIAAATEERMVVNYPNVKFLNPQRNATRAEVAAFIYQALVSEDQAQTISSQYIADSMLANFTIPAGTTIPVKYIREKILVAKEDEELPLTLTVDANITTSDGRVLIPAGSEVVGELRSTENGAQFFAEKLVMNGQQMNIDASSELITTTETIRQGTSVGNLVKNAALGTAAAAAISAVTGDRAIATEELLIGAGSGVALSLIQRFLGRNSVDLYVIEPDTDLDIKLNQNLVISPN
ncbi:MULTISPECIES: S-layer homology domain-containing protein [unclassified Coleofasciculus]|uniref:S-layer homology domain-containing protein n=1 Tax=unclassified Coleofasciculus TaxID=2692782 RepID=UPI00187FD582|nr:MULTISPECIES: S-layer homology domain-containing protein [unclassified Coleofasciculus]MBE9129966.1 S-layer homology domain-containing protein [Coleofasciculus sp. LEGE 07081]MBE9152364.1 S-layer homology domain-containing protein [Coleofasciculus sp. LEGE 07092]